MKQVVNFKLSRHLALTPQLQQSIRLLQLSTLELSEELGQILSANPLLERDEGEPVVMPLPPECLRGEEAAAAPDAQPGPESSVVDCVDSDFGAGYGRPHDEDDEPGFAPEPAGSPGLCEHLLGQLGTTRLSQRDKVVASLLIAALDERGYLTETLEDVACMLPPGLEVGLDELEIGLRQVQNFDPVGVGARTPAECLELQLRALPPDTGGRELALRIVREHLDLLAAREFAQLMRRLRCGEDSLRAAQRLIRSLNPYPGAQFASDETRYIVPDVIVKKAKQRWSASLNADAMPRLRINRAYADIVLERRHAGAGALAGQLQEARWLIRNMQQRFDTILRVAQAIVERQHSFFDHGEVAMRPLVLREIAEVLGLHESTVSRVTRQKFMATPRGIFELRYFFGSQLATESGGACSATAIRELLRQLVLAEDRRCPLSDGKIAQMLRQQGVVVARRTIAKYRDSIRVPPANRRAAL